MPESYILEIGARVDASQANRELQRLGEKYGDSAKAAKAASREAKQASEDAIGSLFEQADAVGRIAEAFGQPYVKSLRAAAAANKKFGSLTAAQVKKIAASLDQMEQKFRSLGDSLGNKAFASLREFEIEADVSGAELALKNLAGRVNDFREQAKISADVIISTRNARVQIEQVQDRLRDLKDLREEISQSVGAAMSFQASSDSEGITDEQAKRVEGLISQYESLERSIGGVGDELSEAAEANEAFVRLDKSLLPLEGRMIGVRDAAERTKEAFASGETFDLNELDSFKRELVDLRSDFGLLEVAASDAFRRARPGPVRDAYARLSDEARGLVDQLDGVGDEVTKIAADSVRVNFDAFKTEAFGRTAEQVQAVSANVRAVEQQLKRTGSVSDDALQAIQDEFDATKMSIEESRNAVREFQSQFTSGPRLEAAVEKGTRALAGQEKALKRVEEAYRKVSVEADDIARSKAALESSSDATAELAKKVQDVERATAELGRTQQRTGSIRKRDSDAIRAAIASTTAEIQLQQRELKQLAGASDSLQIKRKFEAAAAQNERLLKGLGQTNERLKNVEASSDRAGARLAKAASTARGGFSKLVTSIRFVRGAITTIFTGLGIKSVVDEFVEFRKATQEVQAFSGVSQQALQRFEDKALETARKTRFSTVEVAKAQSELALKSFEVADVLAITEESANLAAAANVGLDKTAQIVGATIKQFGLDASQAEKITDQLAVTTTSSSARLETLGKSLEKVAPIAKTAGISFEDTQAALALLAEREIQGEEAGTALRNAISRLIKPSGKVKKALERIIGPDFAKQIRKAGSQDLRNFSEIFALLEAGGITAADSVELFGLRAEKVGNIIGGQSERLANFRKALEGDPRFLKNADDQLVKLEGTADRIRKITERGIFGAFRLLGAAFSGLTTDIAKVFEPAFVSLASTITDALNDASVAIRKFGASRDFKNVTEIVRSLGSGLLELIPSGESIAVSIRTIFDLIGKGISTGAGVIADTLGGLGERVAEGFGSIFGEDSAARPLRAFEKLVVEFKSTVGKSFEELARSNALKKLTLTFGIFAQETRASIGEISTIFIDGLSGIARTLSTPLQATLATVSDLFFGTFKLAASFVGALLKLKPKITSLFIDIQLLAPKVAEAFADTTRAFADSISGFEKIPLPGFGAYNDAIDANERFAKSLRETADATEAGAQIARDKIKADDDSAEQIKKVDRITSDYTDKVEALNKSVKDGIAAARGRIETDALGAAVVQGLADNTRKAREEVDRLTEARRNTPDVAPPTPGTAAEDIGKPTDPGFSEIATQVDKTGEAVARLITVFSDLKDEIKGVAALTGDSLVTSLNESAFASDLNFEAINRLTQANRQLLNSQLADVDGLRKGREEREKAAAQLGIDAQTGKNIFPDIGELGQLEQQKLDLAESEDAKFKIQQDFLKKRAQADKNFADAGRKIRKAERAVAVRGTASLFGAIASVSESGGKKVFAIQKTFAIANAIVSTLEGASAALKIGPAGIPLAAAIALSGFARVRQIKSTTPGGGGSVSVGGGSLPTPSNNFAPPTPPAQAVPDVPVAATALDRGLQVIVEGNVIGEEEFVRDRLAPVIKESIGDNEDFGLVVDVTRG